MKTLTFLLLLFISVAATGLGVRFARVWYNEGIWTRNYDKTFSSFFVAFLCSLGAAFVALLVALPNPAFAPAVFAAVIALINLGTRDGERTMLFLVGTYSVGIVGSLVLYFLPLFG